MADDIDTRIDAERQKLDAFAEEARAYLDALEREIAARLRAIGDAVPGGGAAFSGASARTSQGGGDDWFGGDLTHAFEQGIGGSLASLIHGRSDPKDLLRAPAGAFGRLIGDDLVQAFGLEDGMRLSESQSSLERSAPLQRARRNL